MKISEFNAKRNVKVTTEDDTFDFDSYADIIGNFNDVVNREEWANAYKNVVFVAHRFDTIGRIVETFDTNTEAKQYAEQLNEYYGVCEEFCVEEILSEQTN